VHDFGDTDDYGLTCAVADAARAVDGHGPELVAVGRAPTPVTTHGTVTAVVDSAPVAAPHPVGAELRVRPNR